eukprot:6387489-Pyramimonas_sp.AAC.1
MKGRGWPTMNNSRCNQFCDPRPVIPLPMQGVEYRHVVFKGKFVNGIPASSWSWAQPHEPTTSE